MAHTKESLLARIAWLAFQNPRIPAHIKERSLPRLRDDMRHSTGAVRVAFQQAHKVAPQETAYIARELEAIGMWIPEFVPAPRTPGEQNYNLDKYVDYSKCHTIPKLPTPELPHHNIQKDTTMNVTQSHTTVNIPTTDFDKAAEYHEKALADIAAQRAAAAEREALVARIGAQQDLLSATRVLLGDLHELLVEGRTHADSRTLYAKHRKELAELAGEYGFKIVLVGDKTRATLVKV